MVEGERLPRPGDTFAGRYRIDAELGRGGFGAVFRARDAVLGRDVALKVLRRGGGEPVVLARFLQEARAAAQLSSEHVAVVHEVGVDGGADGGAAPYLVMELLRGRDLADELAARGPLPVAEATRYVLEAMLGLAHAHARQIVHRDLKPRNLFLAQRQDGTAAVKVLDFGVAKSEASPLTQSGATLGTPRYMAPEQLRSARAADARTDIWALGAVLYELASGAAIYDAESALELAAQIAADPHVPLRARDPSLPEALERAIDRCLEKEPARRYADLAALAAALAPFAPEAGAYAARIERTLAGGDAVAAAASEVAPRISDASTVDAEGEATAAAASAAAATRETAAAAAATVTRASAKTAAPASPEAAVHARPAKPSHLGWMLLSLAVGLGGIALGIATLLRGPAAPPPVAAPPAPALAPGLGSSGAAPGPGSAEIDGIYTQCRYAASTAPTFVVPGNDGPASLQCGRLSQLGCAELARRCGAAPIGDGEHRQCRDFLGRLTAAEVCRR